MPKIVIADANVLVKWFVPEKYSRQAQALLEDHLKGRIQVVCPAYSLLEFANTMRKYTARNILTAEKAARAMLLLEEAEVIYQPITPDNTTKALSYAMDNGVTVYDAYYIVLASRYNTYFYTADEKLLRKLKSVETRAKHIKDYPSKNL